MSWLECAWFLLCSHAVCDGSWQTSFLAKYKHPTVDNDEYGPVKNPMWVAVLSCHAIVCGFGVSLATGIWWLGPLEALWHWITDFASTRKYISFKVDQISHLTAKVVWLVIWCMVK